MKYTILKHFHISNFIPKILRNKTTNSLSHNIIFDKSCLYKIDEKSCVNKLFGFCYGLFGVHKNSIRFGWTAEDDKIYIWRYIYKDGKLYKEIIYIVYIGEEHRYEIQTSTKDDVISVELHIDGVVQDFFKLPKLDNSFIYTLGFYFGGNTRAPHKMHIINK